MIGDDELAAIWRAADGAGPFNGIVRLLLLTGQRRDEAAGMTWAELSGDCLTWTIPASRAKNGATRQRADGVIDRSKTRDTPHSPVTLYEVAHLFGTLVAETILASVHVRTHSKAGHMDASDLIRALQNALPRGAVHIWGMSVNGKA